MSRINFLFILIIGLTACTPNTTPSPVVTSSPTASIPSTSTATEILSIPNPIDPENMELLTMAGYIWDEQTGSLKNEDGNAILSFENGKWVDETGAESSVESLKINMTDGVNFDGEPIVAVLTRTVEDQTQLYNPEIEGWQVAIDVNAAQAVIAGEGPSPTYDNHGTYKNFEFSEMVPITWEEIENGRLFYSEQLALRDWPENVLEPKLQYVKWNHPNYWGITQYPLLGNQFNAFETGPVVGDAVVWENDPIRNLAGYRVDGENVVIHSLQYRYNGNSVILKVKHEGRFNDPNSFDFVTVQQSISDPSWLVVEPSVHNDSNITPLLPIALQQRISELNGLPPMRTIEAGYFPVGDEIFAIQRFVTENIPTFTSRHLQLYLRSVNDPIFDKVYLDGNEQ
jgi:hypothetical protein